MTRSIGKGIAAAVALAAAPFFLAPYATTTLTRVLIFAMLAVSLDLLVGITGLPSLGHGAYFGVGAYAAGWAATHGITQAAPQLAIGFAVAAVAASIGAAIAVRTQGVFFLMLTLAIGELIQQLAQSWQSVTGGSNGLYGIPATRVGGAPLAQVASLYWYVAAVFLIGSVAMWSVSASPLGATLRGIRDNEPRMRALGYPTTRYKLAAFVIAGGVAGIAGALLAAQQRLVTPADLGFATSAFVLLAVVIGGAGKLWGACLGAALVVVVRDYLGPDLGGHGPIVLGLVFIAIVYLLPRGVAGVQVPQAFRRRGRRTAS
jgi:branched-chain amino acid transport system permease protein